MVSACSRATTPLQLLARWPLAPDQKEEHEGAHDHTRLPCLVQLADAAGVRSPLAVCACACLARVCASCASAESLLQDMEAHGGFKRGEEKNVACPPLCHAHSVAEDQPPAHTRPMGMPMEAQISMPLTSPASTDKELRAPATSRYQLFVKAMTAKLKVEGPDCNQVPVPC